MPCIHVVSLPFEEVFDAREAVENISREFAATLNLDIKGVAVAWDYLHAFHYAHGGKTYEFQGVSAPPLLVTLDAPEVAAGEPLDLMARCAAQCVARQAKVDAGNVQVRVKHGHRQPCTP